MVETVDIAGSPEEAEARERARAEAAEIRKQIEDEEKRRAAAEAKAEAEAKAAHEKALQAATDEFEVVEGEVQGLMGDLGKSLAKGTNDRAHVVNTAAYLRDVKLKVQEIRAWIRRAL